jgi:uncharacterized protein (DUF1501 family)
MNHKNINQQRRHLLQALTGSATSLALGAGASLSLTSQAQAQSADYRALVCLFLFGGNDGLNTFVPLDESVVGSGYSDYAATRKTLALPRSTAGNPGLVELTDSRFGMHPGLAPLASAWADGAMAMVHNVGPLARPMTQAQYVQWRAQNNSSQVPESLFSHSDQQRQWESAATTTISPTGWGGAAAELIDSRQVISIAGNTRFGTGVNGSELVLPEPGSSFGLSGYWSASQPNARLAALETLMAENSPNRLQAVFANQQRTALALSRRLEATIKLKPGDSGSNSIINSAFSNLTAPNNSRLAKQLYQVAKLVEGSGRTALGGSRHIFFVSLGGFDTHANQLTGHANLMSDIGRSVGAFYAALKNLGLSDKVTLFTASDFGRTFKTNSSGGTDHAWGNEHFVVGGGVQPKVSVGQYPQLVLGGPNDAADPTKSWEFQGRWIPTTSVSQYAGSLLKWLNPAANVAATLPGLNGFGGEAGANIGLMKV